MEPTNPTRDDVLDVLAGDAVVVVDGQINPAAIAMAPPSRYTVYLVSAAEYARLIRAGWHESPDERGRRDIPFHMFCIRARA